MKKIPIAPHEVVMSPDSENDLTEFLLVLSHRKLDFTKWSDFICYCVNQSFRKSTQVLRELFYNNERIV